MIILMDDILWSDKLNQKYENDYIIYKGKNELIKKIINIYNKDNNNKSEIVNTLIENKKNNIIEYIELLNEDSITLNSLRKIEILREIFIYLNKNPLLEASDKQSIVKDLKTLKKEIDDRLSELTKEYVNSKNKDLNDLKSLRNMVRKLNIKLINYSKSLYKFRPGISRGVSNLSHTDNLDIAKEFNFNIPGVNKLVTSAFETALSLSSLGGKLIPTIQSIIVNNKLMLDPEELNTSSSKNGIEVDYLVKQKLEKISKNIGTKKIIKIKNINEKKEILKILRYFYNEMLDIKGGSERSNIIGRYELLFALLFGMKKGNKGDLISKSNKIEVKSTNGSTTDTASVRLPKNFKLIDYFNKINKNVEVDTNIMKEILTSILPIGNKEANKYTKEIFKKIKNGGFQEGYRYILALNLYYNYGNKGNEYLLFVQTNDGRVFRINLKNGVDNIYNELKFYSINNTDNATTSFFRRGRISKKKK